MATLTALLTHLPEAIVQKQLDYMRSLVPGSPFVACHGGPRADFDRLDDDAAIFIDDPSLRGPHFDKSLNQTLDQLYEAFVRDDPSIDLIYAIEYDQIILRADFDAELRALVDVTGAGLLGKNASRRNDTNWPHYLKSRDDRRLNDFIASISVRDDPLLRFGCLGSGMLLTRAALEGFCSLADRPPAYVEMFVPTVVYHLGFDIVDVDAVSDLYADVRWLPEYTLEEARAAKRGGRAFVHPFKQLAQLERL